MENDSRDNQDRIMSKKPKQTGTEVTNSNMTLPPWLDDKMQKGAKFANREYNYSRNNPIDDQGYVDAVTQQANSGGNDAAFQQYQATLNGDYLYGGDAFNAAQQSATNRIIPQVTSAFNSSGRMGGLAGQSELAGRIGDSFAGLYNNERGRQMGALSMAPTMNALAYDPAERVFGAEQNAQNARSNATNMYINQMGQMAPFYQQKEDSKPIYSQGGGLGSILGPALSIGGMLMGGPAGMAVGAAGGLLGSSGGSSGGMDLNSQYQPQNSFKYLGNTSGSLPTGGW